MNLFSIWIDADSCPELVRNAVLKVGKRLNINIYFVANRHIPVKKNNLDKFKMIITPNIERSADDYIVENAKSPEIVKTTDIPITNKIVEKNITVINDRGQEFTKENIKEKLSIRNFNFEMAQYGLYAEKKSTFNSKDLNNFCNCLDRILQKKNKINF